MGDDENAYQSPSGFWSCRACERERYKARRRERARWAAAGLDVATTERMRRIVSPQPLPDGHSTGGAELGPLESLRPDGLVTAAQVARAFGCGKQAVYEAVRAGRLTVADRAGHVLLFDPGKIRRRRDGRTGPVDAGHPLAVPGLVRLATRAALASDVTAGVMFARLAG